MFKNKYMYIFLTIILLIFGYYINNKITKDNSIITEKIEKKIDIKNEEKKEIKKTILNKNIQLEELDIPEF